MSVQRRESIGEVMEVRYATETEEQEDLRPDDKGKILLFINSEYVHDAALTVAELVDLRAEIDKFLFLSRR